MKPHEEWLFKSDHDLKSSQLLVNATEPLYDIAIYHRGNQCRRLKGAWDRTRMAQD